MHDSCVLLYAGLQALREHIAAVEQEKEAVLTFMQEARELRYEDNAPPAAEDVDDFLDYLRTGLPPHVQLEARRRFRWLSCTSICAQYLCDFCM